MNSGERRIDDKRYASRETPHKEPYLNAIEEIEQSLRRGAAAEKELDSIMATLLVNFGPGRPQSDLVTIEAINNDQRTTLSMLLTVLSALVDKCKPRI